MLGGGLGGEAPEALHQLGTAAAVAPQMRDACARATSFPSSVPEVCGGRTCLAAHAAVDGVQAAAERLAAAAAAAAAARCPSDFALLALTLPHQDDAARSRDAR